MDDKPVQRRKAKTRQDILDAAYNMIGERGLDGLSIRGIADAIDYSPTALYRYFESKDALLDAVREQCFARLNQALFTAMQQPTTPTEQILAAGLAYVRYARDYPTDYYLMFQLPPSPATQHDNRAVAMAALLHLVRYGIETGVIVPRPDFGEWAITYQCWATVHGLAMLHSTVMQDDQATIEAVTEPILRQVIAGFAQPA